MLETKVFIDSASSIGGGEYSFDLYFQALNQAKYLNIGDYVRDTADNEYEIISLASTPHVDGSSVTVYYITEDVIPVNDSDYNSEAYTPGQVDVRPPMRTEGVLNSATVYDSQNYEYSISASWGSFAEEEKAIVGDSVVDFSGKEYEITFIDATDRFTVPFRAKEVHKEGISPALGDCSLYRATPNLGAFQGTPISDPSRTIVRNRDDFLFDSKFKELEDSVNAIESASSSEAELTNETGSTIIALTPVCSLGTGNISPITVSTESQAKATVGITKEDITTGNSGKVVTSGLMRDITTSFDFGDLIYVSKSGTLTDTAPEIGVGGFLEGDFVIAVGVITKNSENPTNKDLLINIKLMGQL